MIDLDVDLYHSNNYMVWDMETTNKDFGSALTKANYPLVLHYLIVKGGRVVERMSVPGTAQGFKSMMQRYKKNHCDFMVVHSMQFEGKWMHRMGYDLSKISVWDTQLAEWVLHAGKRMPTNLDDTCERRNIPIRKDPFIKAQLQGGVCLSDVDPRRVSDYCAGDVTATYLLFIEQREEVKERKLLHIVYQRSMVSLCLAEVHFTGLYLDAKTVAQHYKDTQKVLLEKMLYLQGVADINWGSDDQLRELFMEDWGLDVPLDARGEEFLTDGGKVSMCADAILALVPKTPEQATVLANYAEYNEASSLMTKNLQFFKGVVDEWGGHFYANINQGFSSTGRLTSTQRKLVMQYLNDKEKGAQIQNIPGSLKGCIIAPDGHVIVDTDAAAAEFRAAVDLARDIQGMIDIQTGHDVHKFTASSLLGKAMEKVTKKERNDAKAGTFKPLYYGKKGIEKYAKAFRKRYPQIDAMQEAWIDEVERTYKLDLPYGIRYHWPRAGIDYVKNQVCNYPVQGMATAEIVPLAMVRIWHELKERGMKARIANTVHDSVKTYSPEGEAVEVQEIQELAFTEQMYGMFHKLYDYEIHVKLGAETQVGKHWGEGEEIKVEAVSPFIEANQE